MKIKIIKKLNSYKTGGEINIKKSHEGLFTQKANRAGMGVQEFASHVLANKQNYSSETIKQAVFAHNAAKWHAEGGKLFNEGGNILNSYHTNGADWEAPGGFHVIGSGGTHEENKNEGVLQGIDPQGVPNLVEENEVVYNDYVFSNRLIVPKRRKGTEKEISDLAWEEKMLIPYEGKTYADAAKKAYKDVQERPNDPIAKRGLETILGILAGSQEKERAKKEHQDAAEEITEMSGQEFAQAKEAEEQQQAIQQAAQQQAIQQQVQEQQMQEQQMQGQQIQEPSPEEQNIEQQQIASQPQSQEYMVAYGGNLHAEGGDLNNESIQQQGTQDTQNTQNSQDNINTQDEEPSFMDIEDPEDLSTTKLNSAIEEIIQYAKENKLKNIVRAGKKAKRNSREEKEEFIEDSIDAIKDFIQQQKEEKLQKQEQQTQEQKQQQEQQLQEQQQQQQEVQTQAPQQQITQEQMQASMSPEQAAQAELNSQMQTQQFADGGYMSQEDQLSQMQQLATMYSQYLQQNNPELFKQTNAELQQYLQQIQQSGQASQEDLQMIPIQYYAARAQKDTEFLNQIQQVQGQQYALGGSMSLDNPSGGDIYKGNKIFSGNNTPGQALTLTPEQQKEAEKQLNKYYKSKGIDPTKLTGAAKSKYEEDLRTIKTSMLLSKDNTYSIEKDGKLAINRYNLPEKKKQNAAIYSNNAQYDAMVSRGAKAVKLTDDGRVKWDNVDGLTKVNNTAENFYSNPKNLIESNGVYDYNDGSRGYKSKNFTSPEEFQQYYRTAITDRFKSLKGNKYSDRKLPSYYLNASELRSWVNDLSASDDPKEKELALALKANWGDKDTSWGNDATWSLKNKYTKNGTVTESQSYLDIPAVKENGLQMDALPGIEHIPYLDAIRTDPTANRYFYRDGEGQQHFITRPTNTSFTISDTPIQSKVGDINYNDYEVTGYNQKRKLYQTPDGRVLDVTDMSDINNGKWKGLDNAVMPDDTSNLGEGVTGESSWVDTDGSEEKDESVKYKLPSNWPWIAGLGVQAGATLYNALTPIDYSNADAVISAAKEAGNFQPVGFRPIGDYLTYRPLDRNYEGNKVRSAMAAERRALANLSGGNRGTAAAGILASDYNLINQLGDIDRKAAESNREHEAKVAEFNRNTNEFNSEGFLKTDMANQEAISRANQARLDGLIKGYAMRQAAEDAKSNAISAGISGIANNLFGLYQNNVNRNNVKYSIDTNSVGTARYGSQGGKLRTRRRRGLTF